MQPVAPGNAAARGSLARRNSLPPSSNLIWGYFQQGLFIIVFTKCLSFSVVVRAPEREETDEETARLTDPCAVIMPPDMT
jgi:hypothetical protein